MSNDLISQDVLLAEFRKQAEKCENFHISAIETEIESAHAVDAVEVVRCKECIHVHDNDCPLDGWARSDEDSCSYGERKEYV